jgi:hypothetical protein
MTAAAGDAYWLGGSADPGAVRYASLGPLLT